MVSEEPGTTRDAIDVGARARRRALHAGRHGGAAAAGPAQRDHRARQRADDACARSSAPTWRSCCRRRRGLHRSGRARRAAHARPRRRRARAREQVGSAARLASAPKRCARTSRTGCASWTMRPCSRSRRRPARASARCSSACGSCTRPRGARSRTAGAQPLAPGCGAPARARDGAARVAPAAAQVLLRHADRGAPARVHAVLQRARRGAAGLSCGSSRTGCARRSTSRARRCGSGCARGPRARPRRADRSESPPPRYTRAPARRRGGRMAHREHGTAAEMLGELESAADRLGEWLQTHLAAVSAAIVGLLVVAGLGAWLVSARESAEQEASTALAQTRADYLSAMGAQPGSIEVPELANPDRRRRDPRGVREALCRAGGGARGHGRGHARRDRAARVSRARAGRGDEAIALLEQAVEKAPASGAVRGIVIAAARAALRGRRSLGRGGRPPRSGREARRLSAAPLGARRRRALSRDGGRRGGRARSLRPASTARRPIFRSATSSRCSASSCAPRPGEARGSSGRHRISSSRVERPDGTQASISLSTAALLQPAASGRDPRSQDR